MTSYTYPGTRIGRDCTIFPFAVLGKPPKGAGNMVRQPVHSGESLLIGDECVIGAHAVLYAGTRLGNNVLIGDHAVVREECKIGSYVVIGIGTTIHDHVTIGDCSRICMEATIVGGVIIEENVFVGPMVITTNDNHMGHHETPSWDPPILRRNCCIGAGAVLLPGVEIGEGAVVGANAVVTHDVPAKTVVMGSPARVTGDLPSDWWPRLVKGN